MKKTIWIGREPFGAAAWIEAAEACGWTAYSIPLIRRQALPLEDGGRQILESLEANDWLMLTSSGAVRYGLENLLPKWPILEQLRIAVVGPGTAGALKRLKDRLPQYASVLTADGRGGKALAQAFLSKEGAASADSRPLLWLRAEEPRREMQAELKEAGWKLKGIPVYRTEGITEGADLPGPNEPALLFSPSGGRALQCRLEDPSKQLVVALGDATAGAAKELGFTVIGVLDYPKPDCLADYLKTAPAS